MKPISLEDFNNSFLRISQSLTIAELRLLYLIIIKNDVIELSQQELADELGTHRRTINIGLKKLIKLNLLNPYSKLEILEKNSLEYLKKHGESEATEHQRKNGKRYVQEAFTKNYRIKQKSDTIVVNEDFVFSVLGDTAMSMNLRFNKDFIYKAIVDKYPNCVLYSDIDTTAIISEQHIEIVKYINKAIIKANKFDRYVIEKEKLLQDISAKFSTSNEDGVKIIRKYFRAMKVDGEYYRIRRPWKKYK